MDRDVARRIHDRKLAIAHSAGITPTRLHELQPLALSCAAKSVLANLVRTGSHAQNDTGIDARSEAPTSRFFSDGARAEEPIIDRLPRPVMGIRLQVPVHAQRETRV